MEQKGLKVKRIDIGSTLDPVTVENATLVKAKLTVERVDAATEEEIVAAAKDTEIVLTRYAKMSRSVVEKLPKLLAIIRYGIGYDSIDVDAATDNRVLVVNVPDFCYEEVSNHAMGMLLMLARKLMLQSNTLKTEGWKPASADGLCYRTNAGHYRVRAYRADCSEEGAMLRHERNRL
jgi:phosphoglycerate dehydrogenase-like enzyme